MTGVNQFTNDRQRIPGIFTTGIPVTFDGFEDRFVFVTAKIIINVNDQ